MNPQRERSKLIPANWKKDYYPFTGEATESSPFYSVTVPCASGINFEMKEYMLDVVGNIGCDFNPCYHYTVYQEIVPVHEVVIDTESVQAAWSFTNGCGIIPENLDVALRNIEIPDIESWLDDFSARAEYHYKTAVDETVLLANFLLELVEMLTGNIEKLLKLQDLVLNAISAFRKMFAKTGDYWLSWNFCIRPTISDVKEIIAALEKSRKRLKWLRDHNHMLTKIKYREGPRKYEGTLLNVPAVWPICTSVSEPGVPADAYPILDGAVWFEVDYSASVVLSSWAWARFDLNDLFLDSGFALGSVWAVMTGLTNPVGIAWEALPFSWLIDWFLSQRTRITQRLFNLSPFEDAEVLYVGWSGKLKLDGKVYQCDLGGTRMEVGTTRYELFVRQPGYPNVAAQTFAVPWSWYQLSILLALFQQKHRRS